MIAELALASLALAASSEEGPEESEWIARFEEFNALRKKYGVPPLTSQERMGLLIGGATPFVYAITDSLSSKDCPPGQYMIQVHTYQPVRERAGWIWKWVGSSLPSRELLQTLSHEKRDVDGIMRGLARDLRVQYFYLILPGKEIRDWESKCMKAGAE